METILLPLIANVVRTYAIFRYLEYFNKNSKVKKVARVGIYIWFLCFTSIGTYLFSDAYIVLCVNLFGIIMLATLYKEGKRKRLLLIASVIIVNVITQNLVGIALSGKIVENLDLLAMREGMTSLWLLWLVIILEKVINSTVKKEEELPTVARVLLAIVPVISIAMIAIWLGDMNEEVKIVSGAIAILMFNMILFYIYDVLQQLYADKMEKKMIEQRVAMYETELEIMNKSYNGIRAFRHDMRHHLNELKFYIEHKEYDNLSKYIERMELSTQNKNEYASSGNREIDSTINYLLQKAEKLISKAEINIAIPENLEIDIFSINVILGNLLENAIEASENSEEKYLKVEIKARKGLLLIMIENSFQEKPISENGKFISRKQPTINHGIGIKSVQAIVEELGGECDISWNDFRFMAKVLIYIS